MQSEDRAHLDTAPKPERESVTRSNIRRPTGFNYNGTHSIHEHCCGSQTRVPGAVSRCALEDRAGHNRIAQRISLTEDWADQHGFMTGRILTAFLTILLHLPFAVMAQEIQTLYTLQDTSKGHQIKSGLLQTSDGSLYAPAFLGGISNRGTILRLTPDRNLEALVYFTGTNGRNPVGGLIQGADGHLYGTTAYGGHASSTGSGTVFRLATDGSSFTQLHSFNGTDGRQPRGKLAQDTNGDLFGTTTYGGAYDRGTIFKITANGSFTSLISFDGTNGAYPQGGVVQTSSGEFYGTTSEGGATGKGILFRLTREGTLTTVVTFPKPGVKTVIHYPKELILGPNGNLYGLGADESEILNWGTHFQVTTNGTFVAAGQFPGSASSPCSPLAVGIDGKIYAATATGVPNYCGAIYGTSLAFPCGGDGSPEGGLISGLDGALYGTTRSNFFRVPIAAKPILEMGTNRAVVVKGTVGGWYQVEHSTDLTTNTWEVLASYRQATNRHAIVDTNSPGVNRFYRAIRP